MIKRPAFCIILSMEQKVLPKIFAGTGRRFIAFLFDLILLNIIFAGVYIAIWFFKYDYIDTWIICLILWLVYFSFSDSLLFKGQSFGKKKLNIELITEDGKSPASIKSFIRAFYLALLYFNFHIIGLFETYIKVFIPDYAFLALISGGISFLIFSTFIFGAFHPFKQTFYDSLTKTFVVSKGSFNEEELEKHFNISRLNAAYFLTFTLSGFCALAGLVSGLILFK